MRKLYFLFLVIINFNAFSQTGFISGVVVDSVSNSQIPGVVISIKNTEIATTTDAFGKFLFKDIKAGHYELLISFIGYQTQEIPVDVMENKTTSVDIKLSKGAFDIKEVSVTESRSPGQEMNTITSIDMLQRPVNSAQDLMRLVPGLFLAQHQGGGKAEQIFLRGFDADHGTDFAVFWDGIPVNMPSHAHGQGYADSHFMIPETIDELNVYKGTYATRYGDFATSGVADF